MARNGQGRGGHRGTYRGSARNQGPRFVPGRNANRNTLLGIDQPTGEWTTGPGMHEPRRELTFKPLQHLPLRMKLEPLHMEPRYGMPTLAFAAGPLALSALDLLIP